jgi:hypothetical protein
MMDIGKSNRMYRSMSSRLKGTSRPTTCFGQSMGSLSLMTYDGSWRRSTVTSDGFRSILS